MILPEEGGSFPQTGGAFGAADRAPGRGEAALGPVAFGATEDEDLDPAVVCPGGNHASIRPRST